MNDWVYLGGKVDGPRGVMNTMRAGGPGQGLGGTTVQVRDDAKWVLVWAKVEPKFESTMF